MSDNVSPRSRTVTLLLAISFFVFGLGGLHRIYVGKLVSGIVQLVTLGGLGIWQIIDIVRILLGTFDDTQGRDIEEW